MADFAIAAAAQPRAVTSAFQGWASVSDEPTVRFVLPTEPLHAWTIVLVAAMAADRRRRGLQNTVLQAAAASAGSEVARAAIEGLGATPAEASHGRLQLLQPIRDLRTARSIADKAVDAMEKIAPTLSPSIARMTRFVFEEMGANIVQHSGRSETGYGVAAIDPAGQRLELAFADAGIGFRASLQRNPELEDRIADDAEALQLAVTPRITGTSTPRTNMGIGLKALTDFSDLLAGDLWIVSGSAMLRRSTTAGQRTNLFSSVPPWQGTWIALDARIA
ncbi:MAG TPA: hypothetical protein VFY71_06530 [Planctomycetota bacterium]|nr:hypothetical protein [Planctomycetota bacterium]